jgi:hypothetical protein
MHVDMVGPVMTRVDGGVVRERNITGILNAVTTGRGGLYYGFRWGGK